jgi:hypothetical protein
LVIKSHEEDAELIGILTPSSQRRFLSLDYAAERPADPVLGLIA